MKIDTSALLLLEINVVLAFFSENNNFFCVLLLKLLHASSAELCFKGETQLDNLSFFIINRLIFFNISRDHKR